MEHCLLTNGVLLAEANMLATYVGLANGIGGATLTEDHLGTWVSSDHLLSFCHFAGGFKTVSEPERDERLLKLAAKPNGQWVFVCDGLHPGGLKKHLISIGFTCRQTLVTMISTASGEVCPLLTETTRPSERLDVANFMANQFFSHLVQPSRRLVSRATAKSVHKLLTIANPDGITGAMMLSETPESIGLYNLCVSEAYRNQRIGTLLVRSVAELAHRKNLPIVLQCQPKLVRWYESLGFSEIGFLHALHRGKDKFRDII